MEQKNIILVDDHIVIRNALKELIEKLGPYKIVDECDNGADLVGKFPLQPAPDLIIMDIIMPEMNGDEVVEIMKERGIKTPVLILSLSHDDTKIIKLFRNGVRGYLKKNCTAKMMKEALQEIFAVGFYHNDLMTFALQTAEKPDSKTSQQLILEKLSPKEREFLKLVCHEDEYTYDQIAASMCVQFRTVDAYRESIFSKFNIRSKTGLVLFILKHDLINHLV